MNCYAMYFELGYKSPIGCITVSGRGTVVERMAFSQEMPSTAQTDSREEVSAFVERVFFELDLYFRGKLQDFTLRVSPQGTSFQQAVWAEVSKIPYGKTVSYEELACRLGDEKKIRAVAQANAKNPIAIFIPCHRVIGKQGQLTGYAWGLERKNYLLNLERGISTLSLF